MRKRYKGWTNEATWLVNLEICDDLLHLQQEDIESGRLDKYKGIDHLAGQLEDYVDEILRENGQGATLELARTFVIDANWHEIAEKWPELIASDDDEEDE